MDYKQLEDDELKLLSKDKEHFFFANDFQLVYESQIPNTAVTLLSGSIELTRKTKIYQTMPLGCILGVWQVLRNEPVKYGYRIKKGSHVLLIGKAELSEALEDSSSTIFPIIKNLMP